MPEDDQVAARRIRWTSDRDDVIAEVGLQLRWGRPDKAGRVMSWKYGATVKSIDCDDRGLWTVALADDVKLAGWNNPILCGDKVTVED